MVWSQQHTVLGALAKLFAVVACKHAGALCNIARFAWMIARRVVVQRLALFIHCGNGVVEEEEEEEGSSHLVIRERRRGGSLPGHVPQQQAAPALFLILDASCVTWSKGCTWPSLSSRRESWEEEVSGEGETGWPEARLARML